jgi:hypothetical protein
VNTETHAHLAAFIWDICNLLRGPYKRNEYRKVILPLTVLRSFDCILAPTKRAVLAVHRANLGKPETLRQRLLQQAAGLSFYNTSRLDFPRLLDDPNQLAPNLTAYIDAFSPNVRTIMERFGFEQQLAKMADKNILFKVVKAFCDPRVDLSAQRVDHMQMGYCFEELIRIGAEQANEEAGEHFTPREDMLIKGDEAENIRRGDIMKKSLGNKRNKIGDPDEPGEPDHIGEITRIHGNCRHDDSRVFNIDGRDKRLTVSMDRAEFQAAISAAVRATGLKLSLPERKLILAALSERDDQAAICTDAQGNPEPALELRDTEIVPLTEAIQTYFEREVLPHVSDAWIDHEKTRIG